jgi:dTDP-4-amino-4,6-dideoxygalactose transaminase
LKNLHGFGDNGMITTNDGTLVEQVKKARNHGLENRDQCDFWSINSRLDAIQAGMLNVLLPNLADWTDRRRSLAENYNSELKDILVVPEEQLHEHHVYQTYIIQTDERDKLHLFLRENGVEALIHYPKALHLQPAAQNLNLPAGSFPIAEHACDRIISLPLYPELETGSQEKVISLIKSFFGN